MLISVIAYTLLFIESVSISSYFLQFICCWIVCYFVWISLCLYDCEQLCLHFGN